MASQPKAAPAAHTDASQRQDLYWIAGAGVALNAFRGFHFNGGKGTLFVDPYWVDFYLSNYADGFRRRALMGSISRVLFPAGVSVLFINVASAVVLFCCLYLLFRAFCRLSVTGQSVRGRLMLFAFACSSMTAVFYETLGDLLHIALLLFCAAALLLVRRVSSTTVRMLLLCAVALVGFFFHEASIFLLASAIPFFVKQRPALRDFVLPVLLLLCLLGLSTHWSSHPIALVSGFHANLVPHGIQTPNPDATPSFVTELTIIRGLYFRSKGAFLYFTLRCVRIVLIACAYLLALTIALPRRTLVRVLTVLGCVVLFSLPLWVVAIDWCRFLTYAVMLALVATAAWPDDAAEATEHPMLRRFVDRLEQLSQMDFAFFGAAFVLFTSSEFRATHVNTMSESDMYATMAFLVVACIYGLRRGRSLLHA